MTQYKSIFISDLHLGTKSCHGHEILFLLKNTDSENLFLVGDIVDGWAMQRKMYWPQSHNDILQKILRKGRKGTKILYTPGNHDEIFKSYAGNSFGSIQVEEEYVYKAINGMNILITHGDNYDSVMQYGKWLAYIGDLAYTFLLYSNRKINWIAKKLRKNRINYTGWCKKRVKKAVAFVGQYEQSLVEACKVNECAAVINGHIHCAELRQIDQIWYMNCGCWVENCTAILETMNGEFQLIKVENEQINILKSF